MVKGIKLVAVVILLWAATIIICANSSAWAQEGYYFFKDLKGSWAAREINYLALKGIVDGGENGNFHPQQTITRAEFIKLLVKAINLEVSDQAEVLYKDVKPRDWYFPYINAATTAGLLKGAGEYFWPEKAISREEGAAILVRALNQEQEAQKLVHGQIHALLMKFPDNEGVSSWADEYIAVAVRERLIIGQPGQALEPLAQLTRGEAAVLTLRLMLRLKIIPD